MFLNKKSSGKKKAINGRPAPTIIMNSKTADSLQNSDSSDPSLNSSYADVFEASGIVIRDYEGSFSKSPLHQNAVTYNLNKCKSNVVIPYFKLLCLIGWRPFGYRYDCCPAWLINFWNYLYTFIFFCILIFWYVIRVLTCNGQLVVDKPVHIIKPSVTPINPTYGPNVTFINWTTTNSSNFFNGSNQQELQIRTCNHIFGTYVIPNFLHFFAFLIGFYHFRVQEHEGLYALMEKVYLQSHNPSKMTKRLRLYLFLGVFWLITCLGTMIHYFFAFGLHIGTGIPKSRPILMYSMATLITVSNLLSNCVNLAAALSYCGQCDLLTYYIDDVAERLEEKSTELKTAMKEILEIKRNFHRLNGSLSISVSLLIFDALIVLILNSVLLFQFYNDITYVWLYRLVTVFELSLFCCFVFVLAGRATSRSSILLDKALSIRVFGFQSHTQLDIDSFLNFIHKVELQAEIFTIPMKPRYMWGALFIAVQVIILISQTGGFNNDNSKWL